MYITPVLSLVIFFLSHQCYSRDNDKQVNDILKHHARHPLLTELPVSIKKIKDIPDLHYYTKTHGADICHDWAKKDQSLLIVVNSVADHATERRVTRATWLKKYGGGRTPNVRVVFFVGQPDSQETADRLLQENKQNGDIVWTHVTPTPLVSHSLNAVAALDWILHECRSPKFVLMVAYYSIINVPAVLRFVDQQIKSSNTIWGLRQLSDRTAVKTKPYFPFFIADNAYLMTGDSIKTLYYGALEQDAKTLFLITGLVAYAEGVNMISNKNFKGVAISSDLSSNSTATRCRQARDHILFFKPTNESQWPYKVQSAYKSCRYNFL